MAAIKLEIEQEHLIRTTLEFSCMDDAKSIAEWLAKPNHPFAPLELTVLAEDGNEWRAVWWWREDA